MTRFSLINFLVVFIVVPQNVYSFFLLPVQEIIGVTGNLSCTLNSINDTNGDFQLCAIRVYSGGDSQTTIIWDGLWFTNTFRQLIATRSCSGFSDVSDVGISKCELMPYEIANSMTLCICATSGCNENLTTCQSSIASNPNVTLPISMPNLTTTIACAQKSETNDICSQISLVIGTTCVSYIQDHSVLCTIGTTGGDLSEKNALIQEDYESYLDNKLHQLKSLAIDASTSTQRETDTYAYYRYFTNAITVTEICACTQNSSCNDNIATCAPISTETSSTSSTSSNSESTNGMSVTNTTIEPETTITTPNPLANMTEMTNSTTSATTAMTDTTTSAATAMTNSTTSATTATTDTTITSPVTATITSIPTESSTASSSILTNVVLPNPNTQTLIQGERGLGTAATAGIACGIILTAVIITAEIVILKFFSSGSLASSFGRSAAYRA